MDFVLNMQSVWLSLPFRGCIRLSLLLTTLLYFPFGLACYCQPTYRDYIQVHIIQENPED
jgi:hypothetical protein